MTAEKRLQKDEWIQPIKKGFQFICCDCSLVHRIDFRINRKHIQFRITRDQKATSRRRRCCKKLYIAASFLMREKCIKLIKKLPPNIEVVSTWHRDDAKIDRRIRKGNLGSIVRKRIIRDYDQIKRSNLVVIFVGDYVTGGGRHTELGIAIGMNKKIALIGRYDHNPFERMPSIKLYNTISEFMEDLCC